MGTVAGTLAMPWFVVTEFARFQMVNSWIALNASGQREYANLVLIAKLRILAVALIVVAVVLSLLRLAPATWALRKRPICERTWPAFGACFVVLAVWFGCAALPYRLPGIVDYGMGADLETLHVEKRGLQFHETSISVFKDSRFFISRNNRRLFRYQFEESSFWGVLPAPTFRKASSLAQSPQLKGVRTQPPKALRAWNAEGWYVLGKGTRVLAFTSEYGTAPSKEIVDLFHEIEGLRPTEKLGTNSVKDVCLGFCYDPLAGLGFVYANNRCFTDRNGKTRCR
jgi:hypothetical protein